MQRNKTSHSIAVSPNPASTPHKNGQLTNKNLLKKTQTPAKIFKQPNSIANNSTRQVKLRIDRSVDDLGGKSTADKYMSRTYQPLVSYKNQTTKGERKNKEGLGGRMVASVSDYKNYFGNQDITCECLENKQYNMDILFSGINENSLTYKPDQLPDSLASMHKQTEILTLKYLID